MNRSEIEVKLIELSMATKSKKEDAAKSVTSVKESIRMEKEQLQNKVMYGHKENWEFAIIWVMV